MRATFQLADAIFPAISRQILERLPRDVGQPGMADLLLMEERSMAMSDRLAALNNKATQLPPVRWLTVRPTQLLLSRSSHFRKKEVGV
jgi:hypothetical protein